jgi:hypothetical protein
MTNQPVQQNFFQDLYRKISLYLHPGSLIVAIAFDLLWSPLELGSTFFAIVAMLILIPMIFIACFGAVTLIQRYGSQDDWQAAVTKGLILGTLAAIPFPFVGAAVGAFWGFMRLTTGVDRETILLGKLAQNWREIERILRRLVPPEMRRNDLVEVIDYLHDQHLLSSDLTDQLHELRKQRNVTMHQVSVDELGRLVDNVQAMQSTLRLRFLNVG